MAGAGTPGREDLPMLTVVPGVAGALSADGQPSSLIDQIVRDGARQMLARQMLAPALQAEVADGSGWRTLPGTANTPLKLAKFLYPINYCN